MTTTQRKTISDTVLKAIIAGSVTVLTTLMALLFARLDQVHHLVNSAASKQQAKLDSATVQIADLNRLMLKLSVAKAVDSTKAVDRDDIAP